MTSIYAPSKYLPMSWGLHPLLRRFIAGLLLLLDLGQEPASALPLLSLADTDDDTVTELCTKETFWWGPSSDEQNIYEAIQSKRNTEYADRGPSQAPPQTMWSERVQVPQAAVAAYTQENSDVLYAETIETSYPLFVASIVPPQPRVLDPSLAALLTVRLLI